MNQQQSTPKYVSIARALVLESQLNLTFTPRERLCRFEWDSKTQLWDRPELDRAKIKELSERSTWNGLFRVGRFVAILVACAAATVWLSRSGAWWMAIPALYLYYFFYGFWVACHCTSETPLPASVRAPQRLVGPVSQHPPDSCHPNNDRT